MSSNSAVEDLQEEAIPSDFECPICLKILIDPVSVPCGHNFCRQCLEKTLRYRKKCPLCRAVICYTNATNHLLSKLIEERFGPAVALRRQDLTRAEEQCAAASEAQQLVPPGTTVGEATEPGISSSQPQGSRVSLAEARPVNVLSAAGPPPMIALLMRLEEEPILPKQSSSISLRSEEEAKALQGTIELHTLTIGIVYRRINVDELSPGPSASSTTVSTTSSTKMLMGTTVLLEAASGLTAPPSAPLACVGVTRFVVEETAIVSDAERHYPIARVRPVVDFEVPHAEATLAELASETGRLRHELGMQQVHAGPSAAFLCYQLHGPLPPSYRIGDDLEALSFAYTRFIAAPPSIKLRWFLGRDTFQRFHEMRTFVQTAEESRRIVLNLGHPTQSLSRSMLQMLPTSLSRSTLQVGLLIFILAYTVHRLLLFGRLDTEPS